MAAKHTPGPWHAIRNDHYWDIRSERDGNICDTCASNHIHRDGQKLPERDAELIATANAHLIAAAPDLLDVARAGVRMREAQRKYFSDRIRDNLLASKDAEREFDRAAQAAIAKAEGRP